MRTARFFVPAEWIAPEAKAFCIPAGAIHKQITMVLRMKVGDEVSLMANDGQQLEGQITQVSKSAVMGTLVSALTPPPLSPVITLCAAVTKRDTFEWTLQKCTELGVTRIIPLLTERVIKRPSEIPQRWHEIVREAAEQSGRVLLPVITEPETLKTALAATTTEARIFFHETGGQKMPKLHATSPVALFIGPEGGFSEAEIALAKTAGAHVVTLGNLVLRAETAAIVGLTKLRFT